ncbi:hypothetical protein L1049_010906 [Liquidambar formosana]|uniref:Uncharacterized protein n=1 Tax=Liquidambar formosana TaxID=63359 RepID=A0AAP0WZD0_LIQFO
METVFGNIIQSNDSFRTNLSSIKGFLGHSGASQAVSALSGMGGAEHWELGHSEASEEPKVVICSKRRFGLKRQGGAYGGFGHCAIDMFEASGACMSQKVCSLYLKRIGSDGWRPGWVKVLHQPDGGQAVPVSYMFYFRTFVPANVWFGFDYCHSKGGFIPHVASFGE